MSVPPSSHPTPQVLRSYGTGQLDAASASTIREHLKHCPDCRRQVVGVSTTSSPVPVRDDSKASVKITAGRAPITVGGAPITVAEANPGPASKPVDELPPGLANHPDYEIKKELGRGGMGVVYLAHNTMMGRDEVLKVMGRHIMERPGVLERFQREIRAVAQLKHANVVTAYTAFRLDGGLVFAMEYVKGLDLFKLVKSKGPLAVAHATQFIYQSAIGLQHAHDKGMVHRDIKPHNLMLTREGKENLVKVLDFGLAKASREEKVDGGLTTEGQALGTPDYIAPEQILSAMTVDIRADLYSLGGTLFFLLTGRPPFQATSLYDMYQAHISRDADPLNQLRSDVTDELAALVAKMMAKNPDDRFQTPIEVAHALAPFFKHGAEKPQPITVRPGSIDPSRSKEAEKLAITEPVAIVGSKREVNLGITELIMDEPALPDRRKMLYWVAGVIAAITASFCSFLPYMIRTGAPNDQPATSVALNTSPPPPRPNLDSPVPKIIREPRKVPPRNTPNFRPNPIVPKPAPRPSEVEPARSVEPPDPAPEPPTPAPEPPGQGKVLVDPTPEPTPRPDEAPKPRDPIFSEAPTPGSKTNADPYAHIKAKNRKAYDSLKFALMNTKDASEASAAENHLKNAEKVANGDVDVLKAIKELREKIKKLRSMAP